MGNKIYIIWDRQFGIVEGATTDHEKAVEVVDKLNSLIVRGNGDRYTISVCKDFSKA